MCIRDRVGTPDDISLLHMELIALLKILNIYGSTAYSLQDDYILCFYKGPHNKMYIKFN